MYTNRREFIKYCLASAAALKLESSLVGRLQEALAANTGPNVIWLSGANCTGCTVSLANLISASAPKDVGDLLINTINLGYHVNLMGAAGSLAVQRLKSLAAGSYILVVEGGIPTAFNGYTCILWSDGGRDVTAKEAVLQLAPRAAAVLCVGTCAAFGGIPGGAPNPTGIMSVQQITGKPVINIPGCPAHPDWVVWAVANLMAGVTPTLDADRRPKALFGRTVHDRCPRREQEETHTFGQDNRCLEELGCKGPETRADCPVRKWNGGTNWCVGANSICLGCTERGFPDRFSPFYKGEEEEEEAEEREDGAGAAGPSREHEERGRGKRPKRKRKERRERRQRREALVQIGALS